MKQLQVLSFQKKVRQDLIHEMNATDQNRPNENPQRMSTRMLEKQNRINTRNTQKNQMVAVNKKTSQHKKFLTELTNTRKSMRDFHRNRMKKSVEKLNKELVAFHERRAKLERERKERQERARLKALKENDHEGYIKLLEEAKEGRFEELVKKTDEILRRLGAQLVSERNDETDKEKIQNMDTSVESDGRSGSIYAKYLESQNTYYSVAHKLVEKIEQQPSMLRGGNLKPYQMAGLQWMISLYNNKLNGILADEMGLGKTIQTISLITFIMQHKNDNGPHLVIVPLSTIENWWLEFQRWAPHIEVIRYTGHKNTRTQLQQQFLRPPYKFNVCLTQYEYVSRDKKYLKKVPWNYIIMDEGHRIKNANCKLVADLFQYTSKHRLLLTGTPLQNDLTELWALLHFLLPKVFDSSVNFEDWFNSPINNATGDKDKVQMTEEETLLIIHRLHQVLRPFLLRREKKDVEDQLPEKVERVIRCELSAMQKRFYKNISEHNKVLLDTENGQRKNLSLNNTVMQLRKVCNHPYLFLERHPDLIDTLQKDDIVRVSGKFVLLDRILPKLRQSGHRVLLFSQMTGVLDIISDFLDLKKYPSLRLDGNVKAGERGQLVKDFNDKNSNYFVFLLSTRAGGLGLNLQSADTVIIFDSDWNPQQDLQAMARAHRIGQTKKVSVLRLVTSGTVEERIHEVAQKKQSEEARVIKAGLFNQKSTHHDRHEMLQQLLKSKSEVGEMDVPNDEQLNHIVARDENEFELFEKMDRERDEAERKYWESLGKPVPARLMTEDELPDWLKSDDKVLEELEQEDVANFGRGKRSRGIVKYNVDRIPLDSDDELDFGDGGDEILDEEDEEDEEEEEKPKRGRGRKKAQSKKRKIEDVESDSEQAEEEDDESGEGRSKRKRRAATKARNEMQEQTKPKQKRGRKKKQESSDSDSSDTDIEEINRRYDLIEGQLPTDLQKRLYRIWRNLVTLNDGTHNIALLFMTLPDPKFYADYYQLIKNPIAFDAIEQKIKSNQYPSIDAMAVDIMTLCQNAQSYNQEGSQVYNDSIMLMDAFQRESNMFRQQDALNNNNIMVDDDFGASGFNSIGQMEQPPF
jgi:ATP-dependent helicase STH1/SNF2